MLFVAANQRNSLVLKNIVDYYVYRDSTNRTDKWRGYNELRALGWDHLMVNNTISIVNPGDRQIDTKNIEREWNSQKKN